MLIIRDNRQDSIAIWNLENRNPLFDRLSGQSFKVTESNNSYVYQSEEKVYQEQGADADVYQLLNSIFLKSLEHQHLTFPLKIYKEEIIDYLAFTY